MFTEVGKLFDLRIKEKCLKAGERLNPKVLSFLLNHERKGLCIGNLCDQILIAEQRQGAKMTAEKRQIMIDSVTDMFINAALEVKRQQILSTNEKTRINEEQNRIASIEAEFSEMEKEATSGNLTHFVTK